MKPKIKLSVSPAIYTNIMLPSGKGAYIALKKILINDQNYKPNETSQLNICCGSPVTVFESLLIPDESGTDEMTLFSPIDFSPKVIKCHKFLLDEEPKPIIKYWSRRPGNFVNFDTGVCPPGKLPDFHGTFRDWYQILTNVIERSCHHSTRSHSKNIDISVSDTVLTILQYQQEYSQILKKSKFENSNLVGRIALDDQKCINIYLRSDDDDRFDHSIIEIDSDNVLLVKVLNLDI